MQSDHSQSSDITPVQEKHLAMDSEVETEVEIKSTEAHFSVGDILRGTATQRITPFERKAALINAEIDKFGFGKYQRYLWLLCGFGYFIDLAWSKGVGLAATAIYQEMNVPPNKQGLIFTCANTGLAVGALSFGLISDIIGRRWAFYITCLVTSIFGMLLASAKNNYNAICAIYLLASLGLGGNIPIDPTIALEFLPQNRRFLVSLLSMWQPIGVVFASAIAYGTAAKYRCEYGLPSCQVVASGEPCCSVSSNMGWRYEVIVIGAITLAVFFLRWLVFRFYESPKFLLSRGRTQEAIDVLHKIAKFNGTPPPTLTVADFEAIDAELGIHPESTDEGQAKNVLSKALKSVSHLKGLFGSKLETFVFVLLAIAYIGDYWSFNLAGAFLPIILLRNNVSSGRETVSATYAQYVYIALPGIIGAVIALFSVRLPLLGRKWSLVISAALQGLAMAMYTQVKTTAGYVGLNAFEYVMQSFFNAVLYASAPELFSTTFRASASGMLSALGRIAGIVAPIAAQNYLAEKSSAILWLGAGGIWLSSLAMIFLPVEMRNRQMY